MSKEMIDTDKEWRKIADALFDERDRLKQQLEQSQRDLQTAVQALKKNRINRMVRRILDWFNKNQPANH